VDGSRITPSRSLMTIESISGSAPSALGVDARLTSATTSTTAASLAQANGLARPLSKEDRMISPRFSRSAPLPGSPALEVRRKVYCQSEQIRRHATPNLQFLFVRIGRCWELKSTTTRAARSLMIPFDGGC